MKKLLIALIIWMLLPRLSWAQGKFTKAFAEPIAGEQAIQLKWIVALPEPVTYHVLRRKVGEKTFTRLTTKPLKGVTEAGSGVASPSVLHYLQFRKGRHKTAADTDFYLKLFGVNVYTDNEFARAAGMMYKDFTVTPGQTYQYAVGATYKGKEYSIALSEPVRAGEFKPLAAPIGLKVVQKQPKRIELSWTLRPDVLAYHVYRRSEKGAETQLNKRPVVVIDAVNDKRPTVQYTDTDSTLNVDETYYYRIAALSSFVVPGDKSQPAWLTIKDLEPPVAPRQLHVQPVNGAVRLGWKPSASADCRGYRVFRTQSLDKPMQPIESRLIDHADTTYTDRTAVEGSSYYYVVKAEDGAGNLASSAMANILLPDLTPPALPAGLTVQTDTLGHVTLRWRANAEADLKGYFVYRGLIDQADNYAQLQLKPLTVTMFRDTLPRNSGNAFYYRVTAVDKVDNESMSARLMVRLPDHQPPRVPRLNTVVSVADSVELTWEPSASADVRSYQILRRNESDRQTAFRLVGRTALRQFTDRNVGGSSYSYAIMAIDSAGNQSKPSLARVAELAGKYSLTAPGNVTVRVDNRKKTAVVSWVAVPQPAHFTGYRVLMRNRGGSFRVVTALLDVSPTTITDWDPAPDVEVAVVAISQTGQQVKSDVVAVNGSR